MPTQQTILWTSLPNGVVGEGAECRLRLSVFVSPRLRPPEPGTLSLFPDFLDWAARMSADGVVFDVAVENGPTVRARIAGSAPEPRLWAACFGPDTSVRPHRFDDYADRPFVTYPVQSVMRYIRERYQEIAARSPVDLPAEDWLSGERPPEGAAGLGDLLRPLYRRRLEGVASEAELSARLAARIEAAKETARARRASHAGVVIDPDDGQAIIAGDDGDVAGAFERAMLFHYRPAGAEPAAMPATEEDARRHFEETIDFHRMLSALGEFPQLLRRLGLVFDLEVPADSLPTTPTEPFGKLRVVPSWASSAPAGTSGDYSPWTVYILGELNGRMMFIPVSRQSEIAAGLWTPPSGEVAVLQVDADGAALKTLNTAGTLARLAANPDDRGIEALDATGLAALRTGGVSLVRAGQAASMNAGFNRAHNLDLALDSDPPQIVALYAEDLTRGYRIDILEGRTGEWRSLHGRRGTYTFLNLDGTVLEIPDEGFVQLGVTERAQIAGTPPDSDGELYVHESLATWDGWSLSAPRPGKSISRSPRAPTPDDSETQPQRVSNTAMTSLRLETAFRVQSGSLPRLRFGAEYRLRVRTVDLAGNSPTLGEATELVRQMPGLNPEIPHNDALIYRRYESVAAPALAPRAPFGEGESAERLVIRSNYDASAEEYAAAHPPYLNYNDRHVAAPKASLQLVETHGMLDAALDARHDGLTLEQVRAVRAEVYALAQREKGSLSDTTLPTVTFVETGRGSDGAQGYAVHAEEQLELPYLPDPLARGAVFVGLPGTPDGTPTAIPFGGDIWHEATPFRVRIADGDGPPDWNDEARILTVPLPKAGIVRVRLSSMFDGDLQQMGLWRWLEEGVEEGRIVPDVLDELALAVHESRHWMFTPNRDLTLVHAVQQPLAAPDVAVLDTVRDADATHAHLRGEILLHAPSTAKLDLQAEWSEQRDDPAKPAPETIDARAHVLEIPVAFDGSGPVLDHPEFRDALRIEDDQYLVFDTAQSAHYARHLRERLGNAATNAERIALQAQIEALSRITAHEFGDTKHRRVSYELSATTRFREYFAPAITDDPGRISRTSGRQVLDIPSSALPASPRVLYALPTFGWETATSADGSITSTRRGGGLRIYLDRPWYSSGDGELLGVVLGRAIVSPRAPEYPYSTYWGQDPVWRTTPLAGPRLSDFGRAAATAEGLPLPELRGDVVSVAGHPVAFDPDRRLWYCDIELGTGSAYYPFVRLALARYQPNALRGAHLSPVVLADFVQTAPDRTVTVSRDAGAPDAYTVSVSGPAYSARRDLDIYVAAGVALEVAGPSEVEGMIQRRDAEVEDEVLGWLPTTEQSAAVTLAPGQPDSAGVLTWTGRITVPDGVEGQRLRLVVREFERVFAAVPGPSPRHALSRRLVYADTIEL